MGIEFAAHVTHIIKHSSLLGMILKAGAGILAAAAIGAAITILVANPIGAAVVAAAGVTGAAATVTGMAVSAVVVAGVSKAFNVSGIISSITNAISGPIDKLCPPEPSGTIITGSPNIFVGKKRQPLAVTGISEVACRKHSPVQRVAEGSETVHANQIWEEGAPPCLAHRKEERSTCDGKTAEGEPTVHIGGPSFEALPITPETPPWLEKAAFILSVGISLCTGNWKDVPGKLGCLALGMAFSYGADYLMGNPVHMGSGAKVQPSDDEVDFTVISRCPISWERFYNSLDTRGDGPHGPGWSVPYSVQLKLFQPGEHPSLFVGPQGREIPFDAVEPGTSLWNSAEGFGLFCMENGEYVVQDLDGTCFLFGRAAGENAHTLPVQRIEDIFGSWIRLRYAENGALRQLADSAGHLVEFDHSPSHPLRITAARVCDFDPKADAQQWRRLASYEYDASGRLASVTNALGVVVRTYTYGDGGPGHGLMTSQRRASGLESTYEWGEFADHPRVVRTRLNSGRQWAFAYDLDKRVTVAVDSLGNRQRWTWDERYNILSHTDALGNVREQRWDKAGRLAEIRLPNGGRQQFEYDERGNLTKEIAPDGGVLSRKWHHRLPLLLEETDPAGDTTAWEYDDMGALIAVVDPAGGRAEYANDPYGQPVAATDPAGGEYSFTWSKAGQLVRHVDCSGKVSTYTYDADGNPLDSTDPMGQTTSLRHDAARRLISATLPDASTLSYAWDDADRLVASTDAMGQVSRLSYNLHDDAVRRTDPTGRGVGYAYDVMGNLTSLTNENGESYTFGYNAAYQQISQTGLDGITTRYELDVLGLPVAVVQGANTDAEITTRLDRDILGRLTRKTTAETVTEYAYDPVGRVTEITRTDLQGSGIDYMTFAYDALGNLTEERTTAGGKTKTLKHCYDPLGNRTQTTLPDGRTLNFTFCGSGFLHQITTAEKDGGIETMISAFERDDLQREVLRTQGRRHARSVYDPLSRLRERQSDLRQNFSFSATHITKEFSYDKNGELIKRTDNFVGLQEYKYDASGRITFAARDTVTRTLDEELRGRRDKDAIVEALYREEKFAYDAASNLLSTGTDDLPLTVYRPTRPSDYDWASFDDKTKKKITHNRLTELEGFQFKYDELGRTIEKVDQDLNGTWEYKYNCESQLTEVLYRSRHGFSRIRFTYDAIGRRIGKTDGKTETSFVWDGMQLLQEEVSGKTTTYLYEQKSYVPLARMDTSTQESTLRIYYFHCNASGQPEEMTDTEGNLVWRARYSTWGKVVFENVTKDAPYGFVQNLRMQGQYADAGTGLCYNTFRYYDADTGRFIVEDPIGLLGGENLYQYAPNPLTWIDPWGLNTSPTLPPGTIVKEGGVTIEHYYGGNDHLPAHAHVKGEGPTVKIGANGKPIAGQPELSPQQKRVVVNNKSKIRSVLNKINRWFKFKNHAPKKPPKGKTPCGGS